VAAVQVACGASGGGGRSGGGGGGCSGGGDRGGGAPGGAPGGPAGGGEGLCGTQKQKSALERKSSGVLRCGSSSERPPAQEAARSGVGFEKRTFWLQATASGEASVSTQGTTRQSPSVAADSMCPS
jgi:hypothetical protein